MDRAMIKASRIQYVSLLKACHLINYGSIQILDDTRFGDSV
jgi:hypothetical protein